MDTFESEIYPTNREFFGSEWSPGVDGDPHLYVLYASNLGWGVLGYFFSNNEYLPAIREHSNVHEMFVINTTRDLDDEQTYSTLAHEFQHMIHWYQDHNEGELLDEGFAELASFINGYSAGGHDRYYSTDPDIALADWHSGTGENSAHYGANFLFTNYFLNRFGEEMNRALGAVTETQEQKSERVNVARGSGPYAVRSCPPVACPVLRFCGSAVDPAAVRLG